jgi:phosphoglucosamine mutase
MGKYFGTDGIRGVANEALTPELAFKIGRCGGYALTKQVSKPKVLIGRDTRISGVMLEAALVAGLLSIGAEVVRLGVISTPGVAYLTRIIGAQAGVMISASHNPVEDNGIKFFGHDGFKLLDEVESEIEQLIDETEDHLPRPTGANVGTVTDWPEGATSYSEFVQTTIDSRLDGLKIVLDCANGAASDLAGDVFRGLGAEVVLIHAQPNGLNINDHCGSTHPEDLQTAVVSQGAHLGLAFDGDADRCIAIDDCGQEVDGDYMLCICGTALRDAGKLANDTVVSTVMSNLGFYKAAERLKLSTEQTAVGDRYVMEAMRKHGYNFGGEQSGHVIFLDYNTTGDGILTGVQLAHVVKNSGKALSELKQMMRKYPQKLVNVRVTDKSKWAENEAVAAVIAEVESELDGNGRVLVRPSGTESLIRVMVEGPDEETVNRFTEQIVQIVEAELI